MINIREVFSSSCPTILCLLKEMNNYFPVMAKSLTKLNKKYMPDDLIGRLSAHKFWYKEIKINNPVIVTISDII